MDGAGDDLEDVTTRVQRVLVVTSSWPRTGDEIAGTFVRSDALVRQRAGACVSVAAPRGPGIARAGEGLKIHDVAHGGLFGSPGAMSRFSSAPWRIAGLGVFACELRAIVAREQPTQVVAHWLVPIGGIASVISDVPLEVIAHGGDVRLLEAAPRSLARTYMHWLCDRAERVRVVSAALATRLARVAPRVASRFVVEPMPVAVDELSRARLVDRGARLRDLAPRRPLHVVASRLDREKQLYRVIDHVGRVGGSLVVVGDGPARASLERRARASGVDVRMLGALPHELALSWIAAADVVVAAVAKGEGAPTVIREAQALGRTVVVV